MEYPRNPPGLIWDGYLFNEQIEDARKRASQMTTAQSTQSELTIEQRRAKENARQRLLRQS